MRTNRKDRLLVWGGVVGCILSAGMLRAEVTGSVDVAVEAEVRQTINATSSKKLDFGVIELDPAGDAITIDASGGATTTVNQSGNSTVTGAQSGSIVVQSALGFDIYVKYPDSDSIILTGSDPTNTVIVDGFTAKSQGSNGAATAHVPNVDNEFNIGGVLHLENGGSGLPKPDTYTGTLPVELRYN